VEGSIVTETAPTPPASAAAPAPDRPRGWRRRAWLTSPFLVASAACVAVAALSAVVLPTVPSYDPWAWIVWGREVVDPHLSFATSGGPSWKPLPVMFTTIFALFGGAAPTLWVIAARAGGLLGVVAAYRLAARLLGRAPWWAAVAGGVIAGAAVMLTQDWFYYMFRGTSEPMLIGASLWAIDRHLAGRRGAAFVLGVAAALIRPEAWPFLGVYGVWLWWREPRLRPLVIAGFVAVPFFWFVPPWIGSGQPFLAASHAKDYNGHLGSDPLLTVLRRGADLQTVPVLVAAFVGVAIAWFKDREPLALWLAGGALAWWVLVVGMTLDGYPGLERFYLPAAAVACVLAGVGVVGVGRLVAEAVAGGTGGGRLSAAVTLGVAVVLIAVAIPLMSGRIDAARAQRPIASRAVTRLDQLSAAVAAVGGHHGVFPCRLSYTAVNHSVQTALAWKLHVTLGRVGTVMRHQGIVFLGPWDSIDGGPPRLGSRLTQIELLKRVGVWRVYRVTTPGEPTRCVGT
jgi:hypothetical protein